MPPARPQYVDYPGAAQDFDACRRTTHHHGKTYALATRIFPREKRQAIYALYAWARAIDDIVDGQAGAPIATTPAAEDHRERDIWQLHRTLAAAVSALSSAPTAPQSWEQADRIIRSSGVASYYQRILRPTTATIATWQIDFALFDDFVAAMAQDLPTSATAKTHYRTWEELTAYMWGSAAVIGLQLLPLLPTTPGVQQEELPPHATELGYAFQITNFIRDIGEDLQRGRIYLPLEHWEAFGVCPEHLLWCHRQQRVDQPVREALKYFISVNHAHYRAATPGITKLAGKPGAAIAAAEAGYRHILTEIEKADYNVFARRAIVPRWRRLQLAAGAGLTHVIR